MLQDGRSRIAQIIIGNDLKDIRLKGIFSEYSDGLQS